MRDRSANKANHVALVGKNYLEIGNFTLSRLYPVLEEDAKYVQHFRAIKAEQPYIEQLNNTTLYLRIPSFDHHEKRAIDSVIRVNRTKILSTENLIIDITNGTGGSDASYQAILPLVYTNPIRSVGVEFLSTPLNNQRMLDFINDPEYGFDEEGKKWAQASYEKLEKKHGEFVNLNEVPVDIIRYDTVHPYPKNVGIIIDQGNGSTDEQFLLDMKQSRKVKLFGTTTYGLLDVSNIYFIPSPCKELTLGYCLSRSMRIPGLTIDEKGIQPDFFLDKEIPRHEWTQYVSDMLNAK